MSVYRGQFSNIYHMIDVPELSDPEVPVLATYPTDNVHSEHEDGQTGMFTTLCAPGNSRGQR